MSDNLDLDIQSNVLSSALTNPSALSEFSRSNECCDGSVNIRNGDASEVERKPIHIGSLSTRRSRGHVCRSRNKCENSDTSILLPIPITFDY